MFLQFSAKRRNLAALGEHSLLINKSYKSISRLHRRAGCNRWKGIGVKVDVAGMREDNFDLARMRTRFESKDCWLF